MKKLLLIFSLFLLICNNACQKKEENAKPNPEIVLSSKGTDVVDSKTKDSIALLNLTVSLYEWVEAGNDDDFSPLEKEGDSLYSGIDLEKNKSRIEILKKSNLFSENFIENYNKIAFAIDKQIKKGSLTWKIGELPPFGNGANPWCNCQDRPDYFLERIYLTNLSINDKFANYNFAWGDGTVYSIKALKINNTWKIHYLEGFDYDGFIKTFQSNNDFKGSWENSEVYLNIGDDSLAFLYHGQCVYFYPVKKISNTEFEMIWARDMDCKFDNGTANTFNLTEIPKIGKPFAKFTLKNNTLKVTYYYQDWVKNYSEQVNENVFTKEYFRKKNVD